LSQKQLKQHILRQKKTFFVKKHHISTKKQQILTKQQQILTKKQQILEFFLRKNMEEKKKKKTLFLCRDVKYVQFCGRIIMLLIFV